MKMMKMMKRMMLGAAVAALGLTASAVTGTKVNSLATLKSMASTGGECYLNNTGSWLTETITIPAGKTLTLDFYGYELYAKHAGYIFDVYGTLILKNTDAEGYPSRLHRDESFHNNASLKSMVRVNDGGVFTCESSSSSDFALKDNVGCTENGGAVQVANGGTFNMGTRAWIRDCSTTSNGGAVYTSGTFKLDSGRGKISGCTAGINGGAVYVNSGTFDMCSGTIDECKANGTSSNTGLGGAIYESANGVVNIHAGTIQNCQAQRYGGAIEVFGTVNMYGGVISGCKAISYIGGGLEVENYGKFNMSGGKITGCSAPNGGAIGVLQHTVVTISGGEISGNTASSRPASGAIHLNGNSGSPVAVVNITGGTVNGGANRMAGTLTAVDYCTIDSITGGYSNNGTKSKITFDKQSGTGGSNSVDPATYGQAMPTATMPTRNGYTFLGYYDATSGGTQYYKADGTSARNWDKVVAATTLYARWSQNQTLSYNANGHGTAPTAVTMKYTAACNAAAALTGVTGYTFSKWNTKADGTGTSYNANAQVKAANVDPTATTLYAIWTANAYTVAFDGNGATGGATASLSCTYDVAFTMPGCGFTKDGGYAFTGWNTAADGSGTAYAAGANCLNLSATQGATVTLYAQWAAEGAGGNPWSVGGDVVAYTNGTGGLVVSGTGAAGDFSKQSPAPWAAFADQIKSVTIADGVESIGSRFFKGCTRLGTVTGGKNLTSVGENAFYQCMSLETIQLDNADVLETLKNAIVYQTAIKKDGSLYTIPSITLPGCKAVLYGTNDLGDPNSWQPVDSDKTMEESGYHFFKFVLKKIEE